MTNMECSKKGGDGMHSLDGLWAAWVSEDVAESFYQPDFDEEPEFLLPVPGHWQRQPGLERHAGSVFYRTVFPYQPATPPGVVRLHFAGVFYAATVWLNGHRIGEHEGYFQPFEWELDRSLLQAEDNVLAVRVDCPPPGKTWRDIVIGAYGDWDCKPEAINPGGIWGSVELRDSAYGYLRQVRLETRLTAWNSAQVLVRAPLIWRDREQELNCELTMEPLNFQGKGASAVYQLAVSPGENAIDLKLVLPEPKLWWTWDLGQSHLYRFVLAVRNGLGQTVDRYEHCLGIRTVEWKDGKLVLNGRKTFLRGCNYGPTSFYPAEITAAMLQRDVELIQDANLNFVRIYGHLAPQSFYRLCAENGILVWQDFPLHKRYGHEIIASALQQVREMVSLLSNETCIAFWACHNEPHVLPYHAQRSGSGQARLLGSTVRSARPTWNKDVLDPRLQAAVLLGDQTRPVFASSGVFSPLRGDTDMHYYLGWQTADYRQLRWAARLFPRTLRLVTEYGAQAWPDAPELLEEVSRLGDWPNLPWGVLKERYQLSTAEMCAHVRPDDFPDLGSYVQATQEYQAELLQFYHEYLRLRKFSPCAGAVMFMFGDPCPLISYSLLDHQRRPKLAYEVTRRAMQPIQAVIDWPRPEYVAGEEWRCHVYVLNDTDQPLIASGLTWRLVDEAGALLLRERLIADADPNAVTRVGVVRLTIPEGARGSLRLELCLEMPNRETVQNSYTLHIAEEETKEEEGNEDKS
jgi:beta-mannosidase